jgi:nucleotide-binding universal stress UspA family protein
VIEKGEDIEREIVRYMEKSDADVVFLNARSELSTAKIDIIRHVPTPVMIVP